MSRRSNDKNTDSKTDSDNNPAQELSDYQSANGVNLTFSPCCDMFVVSHHEYVICTGCKKILKKLDVSDNVVMRYKSNTNKQTHIRPKISIDEMNLENEKLKRYAIDETFELCDKKCPKCGSESRYCRKGTGELIYICSNEDCREVFE